MKTNRLVLSPKTVIQFVIVISFLVGGANYAYSENEDETVKFNTEYKIKRIPNGKVTVYSVSNEGEKEEYEFEDFNADVVLFVYRKLSIKQISLNLARKYYLSEDESRRNVKKALNILEYWGIVSRSM